MITAEDYILYGFLAFIALLLVSIVVGMYRQSHDIGQLRGQNEGIQRQLTELSGRIGELSGRMDGLTGRMERLEQVVAAQAAELGEVKGILLALNRQMGLLMRHRHDGATGQVILIPEEVAAD